MTLPSRPFHGGHFTPGSGNSGSGRPRFEGGGFFGGGFFRANPKLQAAFKACGANFPRRRFDFTSGAGRAAVNKFVTCVRQHGYNLPAPNFSGKGPVFPASIRTDPKFRSASRTCANLLVPRGAPPPGQPPQSSQSSA